MIQRNTHFANLAAGYLFPEIAKRKNDFMALNPTAKIISLGIGNTTEPLPPHIAQALSKYALALGTQQGYSGYGDEFGNMELREKIANTLYKDCDIQAGEVFISDGAKCDIGRFQTLFGSKVQVAVQDPSYPVYVDGSVAAGAAGSYTGQLYKGIVYLPCTPENDFFPDLTPIKKDSLIYFCSPNNPTGAVATKQQLQTLVDFALKNGCIIIYDSAYSFYIKDKTLPTSIYQIPGSKDCAIEVSSFSKPAGFTGVRLGWSIVPTSLKFQDGTPVRQDWQRVMTTFFNGASNIAQAGGLAALDVEGIKEMQGLVDYYLANANLIKNALTGNNFDKNIVKVYAKGNAPYIWAKFTGCKSWDIFDRLLKECNIVTTPGAGFGPSGESFIRFSAFGHKDDIQEATKRLKNFSHRLPRAGQHTSSVLRKG